MRPDTSKDVIALMVADLHFSHKPPSARAGEKDWYEVMERYFNELKMLKGRYDCPAVIIAGDIFDNGWQSNKCPPQLVNFVLTALYGLGACAVPGQHDLPCHRYDDVSRSAYWTLVMAKVITNLTPGIPVEMPAPGGRVLRLHGFPWGVEFIPLEDRSPLCVEIAVVHQYVWTKTTGYDGAPKEQWLGNFKKKMRGYDIVITGDNHVPFDMVTAHSRIYNCGTFMRRKRDEKNIRPSIGLLHADLFISRHYLDTARDDVFDDSAKVESEFDPSRLLEELKDLEEKCVDFVEALERVRESKRLGDDVWEIVLSALEASS